MDSLCAHRWRRRARQRLKSGVGGLALLLQFLPAHAQAPPTAAPAAGSTPPQGLLSCDPIIGQPLVKIHEIVSTNGVLRGTILLSDHQERMAFRTPPNAPGPDEMKHQVCQPQYVRYFSDPAEPIPVVPPGDYPNPLPGPTLRARVGDVIELAFLNQINPADFGDSIVTWNNTTNDVVNLGGQRRAGLCATQVGDESGGNIRRRVLGRYDLDRPIRHDHLPLPPVNVSRTGPARQGRYLACPASQLCSQADRHPRTSARP